jgi:hypothetical protein
MNMKKSKLLSIVNKAINEVLEESLYAEKPGADSSNTLPNIISPDANTERDPKFQSKYKKISESELDEARRYGIADDARAQDLIDTTSGKAQTRIQQIVDAINNSGGRLSGGGIARALNVVQPQINNLLRTMVEAGILDIEGGTAFSTPQVAVAAGEEGEEDNEQSEFAGDETDMAVGSGNYDKLMAMYFGTSTPEETGEESEEEPITTSIEATPEESEADIVASGSAGKWLVYNSDLIQAIINKTKSASKRIASIKEANDINPSSYKEYAKLSLGVLIDELVEKLKVVRSSNPVMLEKILLNLKTYKFGPTNTLLSYKDIIKKLGTEDISAAPVDTEDLEVDDEEMLDEPIMERFQKLAKIIR